MRKNFPDNHFAKCLLLPVTIGDLCRGRTRCIRWMAETTLRIGRTAAVKKISFSLLTAGLPPLLRSIVKNIKILHLFHRWFASPKGTGLLDYLQYFFVVQMVDRVQHIDSRVSVMFSQSFLHIGFCVCNILQFPVKQHLLGGFLDIFCYFVGKLLVILIFNEMIDPAIKRKIKGHIFSFVP